MSRSIARGSLSRAEPLEARRLLFAGDLDPTFAGDGTVDLDVGFTQAVAAQGDGKVLIAMGVDDATLEARRYTVAGGGAGHHVRHRGRGVGQLRERSRRGPDVSGPRGRRPGSAHRRADRRRRDRDANNTQTGRKAGMVARFNANGTIDTTFSGDGGVLMEGVQVPGDFAGVEAVAISAVAGIGRSGDARDLIFNAAASRRVFKNGIGVSSALRSNGVRLNSLIGSTRSPLPEGDNVVGSLSS